MSSVIIKRLNHRKNNDVWEIIKAIGWITKTKNTDDIGYALKKSLKPN